MDGFYPNLGSDPRFADDGNAYFSQDQFENGSQSKTFNDPIDPFIKMNQYHPIMSQQLPHQRLHEPMDRFMQEQQNRLFFTPNPSSFQAFPQGLGFPISSHPQAQPRHYSPTPSQLTGTSNPSSAQSPLAAPPQDDFFSKDQPQYVHNYGSQAHFNLLYYQDFTKETKDSCVNMSQVQTFDDTQDLQDGCAGNEDEGLDESSLRHEHLTEHGQMHVTTEAGYHGHSYRDEAVASSVHDPSVHAMAAPRDSSSATPNYASDGEEDPEITDNASDYHPSSRNSRKRKATNKFSSPPKIKRARDNKVSPVSKTNGNGKSCKLCTHAPFADAKALQRHIAQSHTRAYTCIFDFAGCTSNFASKNEWKRHVSSQHTNLVAWVCKLGNCGRPHASKTSPSELVRGSEFNRKDLFAQHVRRMHNPTVAAKKGKKGIINKVWEDKLKQLQKDCMVIKREAPTRLGCANEGCETAIFKGDAAWDEKMEHVARHLEKGNSGNTTNTSSGPDLLFIDWAVQQHIIEENPSAAGYRLCAIGGVKGAGEKDAEGEDDVDPWIGVGAMDS